MALKFLKQFKENRNQRRSPKDIYHRLHAYLLADPGSCGQRPSGLDSMQRDIKGALGAQAHNYLLKIVSAVID